ncbi:cyclic nucleotide-binding-like protein [Sporodiniella umbellata]|nr:cyclic nucleotide-binding-like protein [Sporodiniella umbellata]
MATFDREEYDLIKQKLDEKIEKNQPEDILEFCSNYFQQQLEKKQTLDGNNDIHPLALSDDISEEETDTVSDDIPDFDAPSSQGRRSSVSAESIEPALILQQTKIPKTEEQRRRIRLALEDNFLFKHLDEDQDQDVINAMDIQSIPQGSHVIEQDDDSGQYFYIVESGQLDCLIHQKKVTSYGPTESFGELALMYNAPRAATIVAVTDCVLYALDRVTFRSILMENTNKKRKMYERFLSQVPIFQSLQSYERHKIADALETAVFEAGDTLMTEGDAGDKFYLIESGQACFFKTQPDGSPTQVKVGNEGDYFGELALINDQPRAATVKAKTRVKCAVLRKQAFNRLLGPVMNVMRRNSECY